VLKAVQLPNTISAICSTLTTAYGPVADLQVTVKKTGKADVPTARRLG